MPEEHAIGVLRERFRACGWHPEETWAEVELQLTGPLLDAVAWMEETGGDPTVAPWWQPGTPLVICDCSLESPAGRRSLCYDQEAWEHRKKAKPSGNALSMVATHGARLMTEEEYLRLQSAGEFDLRSSSWLLTPDTVRVRGGALFGDRRFGRPFIYCNGAESYYAARGFRAVVQAPSA